MRSEIGKLQRDLDVTTVYVTHDQIEAMTLGHRVAVIRKGVLQQIAPPQELYDQPTNLFVAGFIGSPAMNFLSGTLHRGAGDSYSVKVGSQHARPPPIAAGGSPGARLLHRQADHRRHPTGGDGGRRGRRHTPPVGCCTAWSSSLSRWVRI